MRRSITTAALLIGLGAAGFARADSDDCRVPMADWQPREAVQTMAEAQGWVVRRIKTDDGCYEIKGRDAAGREIEVKVDPATLAIVEIEYDDSEKRDDGRKDGRDGKRDERAMTAPQGVLAQPDLAPPANGLFTPGTKPVVE